MVLDESEDGIALGTLRHILIDASHGIEHRRVALIDVSVAFCDVVDYILALLPATQDEGVDSVIGDRVVGHYHKRRHMVVDTAAPLYERPFTYVETLVDKGVGGKDGVVAYLAVAGYLHGISENAVVADRGVMTDMGLGHDEGVVADARLAVRADAAVDDHVLADGVVVSDNHQRVFPFPSEILGRGGNDGTFVDDVVPADSRSSENACLPMSVVAT